MTDNIGHHEIVVYTIKKHCIFIIVQHPCPRFLTCALRLALTVDREPLATCMYLLRRVPASRHDVPAS